MKKFILGLFLLLSFVGLSQNRLEAETLRILSRAQYEGYTLPDSRTQLEIDKVIKKMKANGYWQSRDYLLNFNYQNTALANFSLINWKNPWSISNLVTYSSDWSDASWAVDTKVPNSSGTLAPDGSQTACYITNVGRTTLTRKTGVIANSTTITYSIYAKSGNATNSTFLLRNETTATNFTSGSLNYSTGVITGAGWTSQSVGNGWYRIQYTQTTGITVGDTLSIYYGSVSTSGGGSTADWYVWGAQVEDRNIASRYTATGTSAIYGNGVANTYGGMTYTLNGWEGNGFDGYIDTHYNPTLSGVNYTQNSASRNSIVYKAAVGATPLAMIDGIFTANNVNGMYNTATTSSRINQSTNNTAATLDFTGTGYKGLIRYSSTNISGISGSTETATTAMSATMANSNQRLIARSDAYGNAGLSYYDAGGSATFTQTQNLRTYFQTFYTNIGSIVAP